MVLDCRPSEVGLVIRVYLSAGMHDVHAMLDVVRRKSFASWTCGKALYRVLVWLASTRLYHFHFSVALPSPLTQRMPLVA